MKGRVLGSKFIVIDSITNVHRASQNAFREWCGLVMLGELVATSGFRA